MRLHAYILLSSLAVCAYAGGPADCNVSLKFNQDLSSRFAKPFNQLGTDLCRVFSASDLLSYATGKSVSPLNIAMISGNLSNRPVRPIQRILQITAGKNLCLESQLPSDLKENRDLISRFKSAGSFGDQGSLIDESTRSCEDIDKRVSIPPLQILSATYCPGERVPPAEVRKTMLSEMDRQLKSGNLVSVLTLPNLIDKNLMGPGHYMTVLGRHWDNGKCMYVVRNSYGVDGACMGLKNSGINCSAKSGYAGTLEIAPDTLNQMLTGVTYIQREQSAAPTDEFRALDFSRRCSHQTGNSNQGGADN